MNNEKFNHIYKVVLIGDAGVGKTHLLNRYVRKSLPPRIIPTIGVEFATIQIPLKSGEIIKAQLWDTAGQEKYRAITSAHYRRAVGAILVYEITNLKTFDSCAKWLEEVRENSDEDIVIGIVGNKLDLLEKKNHTRKVDQELAKKFAQEQNLFFREISAFNEQQVESFFQDFFEQIYEIRNTMYTETDLDNTTQILQSSRYQKSKSGTQGNDQQGNLNKSVLQKKNNNNTPESNCCN